MSRYMCMCLCSFLVSRVIWRSLCVRANEQARAFTRSLMRFLSSFNHILLSLSLFLFLLSVRCLCYANKVPFRRSDRVACKFLIIKTVRMHTHGYHTLYFVDIDNKNNITNAIDNANIFFFHISLLYEQTYKTLNILTESDNLLFP